MVEELYVCSICGYIYMDKETAEKCEAYCKTHSSCSLEITKLGVGKKKD